MLKESSNNNNKNIFSETTSIEKEKMICKDGFCSLPNRDELPKKIQMIWIYLILFSK